MADQAFMATARKWIECYAQQPDFVEDRGLQVLGQGANPDGEYYALKDGVGLLADYHWAPILVEGGDAVSYLHRRLSQAIEPMQPGDGRHALQLDGEGKVQAEVLVWKGDGALMLGCERADAAKTWELIEKYTLMDDVDVDRFWEREATFGLAGKRAREVISSLMEPKPAEDKLADSWHGWFSVNIAGLPCRIFGDGRWPVPFYLISVPGMAFEQLLGAIWGTIQPLEGQIVGRRALERLRIEFALPRYGVDVDERTIPLEAFMTGALDYDKGCFPGQETIAKIVNLGHPSRLFVRLTIEGEEPVEPGTTLLHDGKGVGSVQSNQSWPGSGKTEALGYLKWASRELSEVEVTGEQVGRKAHVKVVQEWKNRE